MNEIEKVAEGETETCMAVSVCVNVNRRWYKARMWPEVMGKQF